MTDCDASYPDEGDSEDDAAGAFSMLFFFFFFLCNSNQKHISATFLTEYY